MSGERMVSMTLAQRDWYARKADALHDHAEWLRTHLQVDEAVVIEREANYHDALVDAFDAARAGDARFAQIRDIAEQALREVANPWSALRNIAAIVSAAAAGERGDDG